MMHCKITKDMKIADALRLCPGSAEIFERHGLGCAGCMAASAETIEEGASTHEIDVEELLKELNSSCECKCE